MCTKLILFSIPGANSDGAKVNKNVLSTNFILLLQEVPPHSTGLGSASTGISIFSHHCLPWPRNIHSLLVHADITPNRSDSPGNFCCKARRCKACPILVATDTFSSRVTGERFNLKLHASCKTSNMIYLKHCRRCGLQYVGETGQPLHSQINSHHFNISHSHIDESPVEAISPARATPWSIYRSWSSTNAGRMPSWGRLQRADG